jgi:hypothetical protein
MVLVYGAAAAAQALLLLRRSQPEPRPLGEQSE